MSEGNSPMLMVGRLIPMYRQILYRNSPFYNIIAAQAGA
jgi:hypothetical protein